MWPLRHSAWQPGQNGSSPLGEGQGKCLGISGARCCQGQAPWTVWSGWPGLGKPSARGLLWEMCNNVRRGGGWAGAGVWSCNQCRLSGPPVGEIQAGSGPGMAEGRCRILSLPPTPKPVGHAEPCPTSCSPAVLMGGSGEEAGTRERSEPGLQHFEMQLPALALHGHPPYPPVRAVSTLDPTGSTESGLRSTGGAPGRGVLED